MKKEVVSKEAFRRWLMEIGKRSCFFGPLVGLAFLLCWQLAGFSQSAISETKMVSPNSVKSVFGEDHLQQESSGFIQTNGNSKLTSNKQSYKFGFSQKLNNWNDEESATASYAFSATSENSGLLRYTVERESIPNPYYVSYDIPVTTDGDGKSHIDMKLALSPFDLSLNDQVEFDYEGTDLIIPAELKLGDQLPDAKGKYDFLLDNSVFLIYEVEVENRIVDRKETLTVDGQEMDCFVVTSLVYMHRNSPSGSIHNSVQKVEDYFLPGYGVIMQNRSDVLIAKENEIRLMDKPVITLESRSQLTNAQKY